MKILLDKTKTIPLNMDKINQHKVKSPREGKKMRDLITHTFGHTMETEKWKP